MKTILIDDEPMALEVLKHMLSSYKEIDIVGSYTKHTDVLKDIKEIRPEIIFLDIEMGEMNGLELAEILIRELKKIEIVFVTAYSQYAVDAFEVNAIDYLLKPIQERRLSKAIERLKVKKEENDKLNEQIETSSKLRVYSFGGFQVIDDKEGALTWRTQKSKELFAYLWTRKERTSSKAVIIESIFPDRKVDKASTLLHTTVYQLRKNLEKLGYPNAIIYSEEGYQLDIPVKSDIEYLRNIIEQGNYSGEDIGEILKLYRGDFLEEGYQWATELQQTYRHLVFKTIETFAKKEIQKEKFNIVLKLALDKLYEINPFSNTVVEMMIHYYGRQGELLNLEEFFTNHEEELKEEMKLKPIKRIRTAYKQYITL